MDRHEILKKHYKEQINTWSWEKIKEECEKTLEVDYRYGRLIGRYLPGSVFGLTPSGKIYAPWTSNQTRSDVTKDEAWWEALEEVAKSFGLWIDCEGDDIFAVLSLELSEESTEGNERD